MSTGVGGGWGAKMLTIKHDLRTDIMCHERNGVTIRHLADLHLGSPNCDVDLVETLIQENVSNHWHTFLVGDIFDVGLKNSKSDVYTQTDTLSGCFETAVELLQPLADSGLILGVVQGNHENRLTKETGLDLTLQLCHRLGVADRYNPNSVLAFIQVGKQGTSTRRNSGYNWAFNYCCHITHGNGGGTTYGARSNSLVKARQKLDADVYLQGHVHHSAVQTGSMLRVNRQAGTVKEAEQLFVCCGSCLTYDNSYGEAMNLPPSDNRYPKIYLHGDKQLAEATV